MATPDEKTRELEAQKKEDEKKKGERKPLWPWLLASLVVIAFIIIVLAIIFLPTRYVWTNDARVMVHYATIAPRVSGQVVAVTAHDYQTVRAGQLLVQLDDRDYRAAVDEAKAMLQRDQAQVVNASASLARQPYVVTQAQTSVSAAEAPLPLARANVRRYDTLSSTGAATVVDRQQAISTLRQAEANKAGAQASFKAAQVQLGVMKADRAAQAATVRSAEAQLSQAQLNLSYTHIVAPLDGTVAERSVQIGNYVSPGATMMALVPLREIYIQANYLEVALQHVRLGQHVRIHVDAYNIYLDGIVESVGPATGATFAPIAPENATGNFTKIVQRLPVKIVLASHQKLAKLLRVGMSVETNIDTRLDNVVAAQQGSSAPVMSH